ncbi:hypothetical protein HDU96_003798 [Phlyctochytrium bullatum]|nr:hypothetical protein HDU96_003798 [Phlyctochytrium bullatum]
MAPPPARPSPRRLRNPRRHHPPPTAPSVATLTLRVLHASPFTAAASTELGALVRVSQSTNRTLLMLRRESLGDGCGVVPEAWGGKTDNGTMVLVVGEARVVEEGMAVEVDVSLEADAASLYVEELAMTADSALVPGNTAVRRRAPQDDNPFSFECNADVGWDFWNAEGGCSASAAWHLQFNYNNLTSRANTSLPLYDAGPLTASCTDCYAQSSLDVAAMLRFRLKDAGRMTDDSFLSVSMGSRMSLGFEAGVQEFNGRTKTVMLADLPAPGAFRTDHVSFGPHLVVDAYADAYSTLVQKYSTGLDLVLPPFTLRYEPTSSTRPNATALISAFQRLRLTSRSPRRTATDGPAALGLGLHLVPAVLVELRLSYASVEVTGSTKLSFDLRGGIDVGVDLGQGGCELPFNVTTNGTLGLDVVFNPAGFSKFERSLTLYTMETRNLVEDCINLRTGEPRVAAANASETATTVSGAAVATLAAVTTLPATNAPRTSSALAASATSAAVVGVVPCVGWVWMVTFMVMLYGRAGGGAA